jgi:indole-3-glycerol phosphate synthase
MSTSGTLLGRIVESTRRRVAERRALPLPERPPAAGAPRAGQFRDALRRPTAEAPVRFLCELKRASPSRGLLRPEFDPEALAREYALGGADALSVLTEPEFFLGSTQYLTEARIASERPCLLKDFVLDSWQIDEAAGIGADAVLLIVALLDDPDLSDLIRRARRCGLDALVEVHTEEELGRALAADADLVGINHRDLETFDIDVRVSERLKPLVSHGVVVVSESGISTPDDVARLSALGVDALLVGEHFMRAESPGDALRDLRRAAQEAARPARTGRSSP